MESLKKVLSSLHTMIHAVSAWCDERAVIVLTIVYGVMEISAIHHFLVADNVSPMRVVVILSVLKAHLVWVLWAKRSREQKQTLCNG